jgi:hypothetical protein
MPRSAGDGGEFSADWARELPFSTSGRQREAVIVEAAGREAARDAVSGDQWGASVGGGRGGLERSQRQRCSNATGRRSWPGGLDSAAAAWQCKSAQSG